MNPAELPLRDIHLPEPVSWWPMAPGWWWVLGLLLLASAVVTGIILYRRYRRSRLAYWLKPEFQALTAKYAGDHDSLAFLQGVSSLLRRACLSLYPRKAVASLTNEDWLELLDQAGETSVFSQGAGRLLAQGPYLRNTSPADVDALLPVVLDWIDHCGKRKLGDRAGD
jgi:hypothetical protein